MFFFTFENNPWTPSGRGDLIAFAGASGFKKGKYTLILKPELNWIGHKNANVIVANEVVV